MPKYTKITIVLKDARAHEKYNSRIIDYLHDRHCIINDNNFIISLKVADQSNINHFVSDGVSSLPAMKIGEDDYIYGANSIMATLAHLEIPAQKVSTHQEPMQVSNAFDDIVQREIINGLAEGDDEDENMQAGKIKAPREDFRETPLSDKIIAQKAAAFANLYSASPEGNTRPSKNTQRRQRIDTASAGKKLSDDDISDSIGNHGFDANEQELLRNMIGI